MGEKKSHILDYLVYILGKIMICVGPQMVILPKFVNKKNNKIFFLLLLLKSK